MDRTAVLWNTANSLVSKLKLPVFNEDNLNTLWTELAAVDPSIAYRAMGIVAEAEDKTLPFFQRQMEGLLIPAKNNQIQKHLKIWSTPTSASAETPCEPCVPSATPPACCS